MKFPCIVFCGLMFQNKRVICNDAHPFRLQIYNKIPTWQNAISNMFGILSMQVPNITNTQYVKDLSEKRNAKEKRTSQISILNLKSFLSGCKDTNISVQTYANFRQLTSTFQYLRKKYITPS